MIAKKMAVESDITALKLELARVTHALGQQQQQTAAMQEAMKDLATVTRLEASLGTKAGTANLKHDTRRVMDKVEEGLASKVEQQELLERLAKKAETVSVSALNKRVSLITETMEIQVAQLFKSHLDHFNGQISRKADLDAMNVLFTTVAQKEDVVEMNQRLVQLARLTASISEDYQQLPARIGGIVDERLLPQIGLVHDTQLDLVQVRAGPHTLTNLRATPFLHAPRALCSAWGEH
jgi:hypothetical protein